MIEKNITNAKLMKEANVSANIIEKLILEKIYMALDVTPNDILEFIQLEDKKCLIK